MQNLEAAVIPMEQSFKDLEILFPKKIISVDEIRDTNSTAIFSDKTVSFLDLLSKKLLKNPMAKAYPDVISFAFFCRKGNINKLKKAYFNEEIIRIGRGIVFHIAPSNVPVNFAYTLLSGLLSGNVNIVRVPTKDYEQVRIISNSISELSTEYNYNEVLQRIILIRYQKTASFTDLFSSICDVRVIWGGDNTINQIRRSIIPAKAFDITFVDRYSICIIDADNYLKEKKFQAIAKGFYNDTYLLDQNACTAPHLIIWRGEGEIVKKAQLKFWSVLKGLLADLYPEISPIIAVNKLTTFYTQAFDLNKIERVHKENNLLWRVEFDDVPKLIENYRSNSGYFSETKIENLKEIKSLVTRKFQTLSYFGIDNDELKEFIEDSSLRGIDRVVPIGKTLDFSLQWDGYDLIYSLSRVCNIN